MPGPTAYTPFLFAWVVPLTWVGLRQGCLFTRLPTGPGACLLPACSVPLPRPDLVDFSKLTKSNANYNLQRAFRTAEQHLGLARLLDPEGEPHLVPSLHPSQLHCDDNCISRSTTPEPTVIPNPPHSSSLPRLHPYPSRYSFSSFSLHPHLIPMEPLLSSPLIPCPTPVFSPVPVLKPAPSLVNSVFSPNHNIASNFIPFSGV